jgi:hypothetical protein
MFGKPSPVAALALRKQLLITESELNRAHLSDECRVMTEGARRGAQQARNVIAWMSVPTLVAAGLLLLRRNRIVSTGEKPSWFKRALKVARLASSVFLALYMRS